jgi:NAD(P)-dependent dehydrogenase (short-subunit alcohol dehydrogenase family)
MAENSRIWFITGCSSGFGRAVAGAALARGDRVIGTLREPGQCAEFERLAPGRAFAEQLDVRDAARIDLVASSAIARFGRIDVLFNNAGYGLLGAVEETSPEEARAILETNFFGTYLMTRALLPQLRSQGAGHVLNMSSGAGIGAVPGLALYSASKFAVEGFSEALAQEIAAFGLRVTIIEPGAFNTGFPSGGIVRTRDAVPAYAALTGQLAAGMKQWYGEHGGDADAAAAAILKIVDEPEPPLRLVLGPDALAGARAKVDALRSNFDAWEALTLSTAR